MIMDKKRNGRIDSGWPSQSRVDLLLLLLVDGSGMGAGIRMGIGSAGRIIRSRAMIRAKKSSGQIEGS
jgi:hypothetical protein